ncbi:hypothetical protein PAHAL_6G124000 [Panicum hallii]|uniref:Uncharacterized protein n=1 Tax=Panicum hallii TaxID=206008 RepID=A0A2T8IG07_9POAL|nr:hypothetical protein PAHAL_6G124000 [Panicum hallii]
MCSPGVCTRAATSRSEPLTRARSHAHFTCATPAAGSPCRAPHQNRATAWALRQPQPVLPVQPPPAPPHHLDPLLVTRCTRPAAGRAARAVQPRPACILRSPPWASPAPGRALLPPASSAAPSRPAWAAPPGPRALPHARRPGSAATARAWAARSRASVRRRPGSRTASPRAWAHAGPLLQPRPGAARAPALAPPTARRSAV